MSWGLATDWLAVAGTTLLTFGTGVQALANLAEFRSLRRKVTKDVWRACKATFALTFLFPRLSALPLNLACAVLVLLPESVARVRARGGDEAVELARFLRLAEIWVILMLGSALALAAAAIQLVLAYQ